MEKKEKTNNVHYPEYWKSRKNRLKKSLVQELERTANSEAVEKDEYGEYKPGTFLHRNTVVTVSKEETSGWSLHIFCEHQVGLPLIKEVRNKYLPDKALMVLLLGSRAEERKMKGVVLYEIPQQKEDDTDASKEIQK